MSVVRRLSPATLKRAVKLAISTAVWVFGGPVRRRGPDPHGVVLLYHGVEHDSFAKQLVSIVHRADVVALSEVARTLRTGRPRIALTFDDGLVSYRDEALPVMRSLGVPSTLFVPSALTGTVPAWDGVAPYGESILDAGALSALDPDLVEIGSHSRTHARLSSLDDEALRSELRQSRLELETMVGRPVSRLAFPYGDHDRRVRDAAHGAGYQQVYTVAPGLAAEGFVVGRVTIEADEWPVEFFMKIRGAYRWMAWWMQVKANRAERSSRARS